MRREVSKTTVATERSVEARGNHGAPVAQQTLFDRKNDDVSEMRGMLKSAAVDAGGLQWLAAHLDVQPSIVSRAFKWVAGRRCL